MVHPRKAAELVASVFGDARAVLDPTAGSGALLSCFPAERRFGIEIDRDHVRGSYEAIAGDAQAVVPMLRAAGISFPAVALNPPFGLGWRDLAHGKGETNSTVLAQTSPEISRRIAGATLAEIHAAFVA